MKKMLLAVLFLFVTFLHVDNASADVSSKVSSNANISNVSRASLLVGKTWECTSKVNVLNTQIILNSQDVYYANGIFKSKLKIGIKAHAFYTQYMYFDTPSFGTWRIEDDIFTTSISSVEDGASSTFNILTLNNSSFVAKEENAYLKTCKAVANSAVIEDSKFSPEILASNSWKCTVNESFGESGTYMAMESINRYSKDGNSSIEGIMKLKLDPELPETTYSIVYTEKWEFANGRFKTKIKDVNITNLIRPKLFSDEMILKEIVSLGDVFKKDSVDEMEVVKFGKDGFIFQDIAAVGEDGKSRYVCRKN